MKDQEKLLAEAINYESTLDTLVEWFGGKVPDSTYVKLKEGTREVLDWIRAEKDELSNV